MSKSRVREPDPAWLESFGAKMREFALQADYAGGLDHARAALKKWPKNFYVRYQFAKMLGDGADALPKAEKKKRKLEALRILAPLTRSLSGKDAALRFGVCINFYYQSEDFLGMARYGRRISRTGDRHGYYALGVGAAFLAQSRWEANRKATARSWAMESLGAWKRYGLKRERYYFAHYCAALAAGVAGKVSDGRKHLASAARLSGKPQKDWEFADALALL